jgi:hypothetical protein
MNDSLRIDPRRADSDRPRVPARRGGGSGLRVPLWIALIVGGAINVIGGEDAPLGTGAGIIAAGCIAGLVALPLAQHRS